jgi:hypothetical protein
VESNGFVIESNVLPPAELRGGVRRVVRRPREWWRLTGMRLFVLPVLLAGVGWVGVMVGAVAWAAWGTDHSARLVRAWSGTGSKGRIVYRADYTYSLEGRVREGSSEVSAGTYLTYRGAPDEVHEVTVRSIGRPPLVYDAVIDAPGEVWRRVGFAWLAGGFWFVLCAFLYREFFVKPRRVKRLHRLGTPVLGKLMGRRVERGRGTRYVLEYCFTTQDGEDRRGETVVSRAEYEASMPRLPAWVLYDPGRPGRHVLYGVGAYECRLPEGTL